MGRRHLLTWILLGAGFAALTGGLVRLGGIFERERGAAVAAAESERTALSEYASRALAERLRAELRSAGDEADAALADPLLPAADLLLVRAGRQLLPPTPRPAPSEGAGDDPEGAAERRRLTDAFLAALDSDDTGAQASAMRRLLAHRALFVLAAEREVESAVELLEAFTERGRPHAALMRGLLRDGVEGAAKQRVEGLQRLLLRARPAMTPRRSAALGRRVSALSRRHGVAVDDFDRAMAAALGPPIITAEAPSGATYLPGGAWLIGPRGAADVVGRRLPLAGPVEVIAAEMLGRGLLRKGERLTTPTPAGRTAVASLSVGLDSRRTAEAKASADRAYAAKRGLLMLCWLLGLAIVALAAVAQQRKLRFVRLKQDFVSMVSHELRTPLASIRVMAETLGRKLRDRPEARDYPERIVRAADRLHGLVENVLTFERAERGRLTPRLERVALGEVVDRASEGLPDSAAVTKAPGVNDVVLHADPELVTLLLSNLTANACRHGGRTDGVRIEVMAETGASGEAAGGPVVVRLSDNGRGISARDRERVFDEFRRGPGGQPGTGLGLAICRRIMRAHGGDIRISETGPEGTTFEMTFPAA